MTEDIQAKVEEIEDSELNPLEKVKLEIEEKKFHYKVERRPIIWYLTLLIIILAIIILAISAFDIFGVTSSIFGWAIFITIVFICIFIGLTIYFFLDFVSAGEHGGFSAVARIQQLMTLKAEIEELQITLRVLEEFRADRGSPKDKYANEVSQVINQYTSRANRNRRFYYILQILIIFCSLLVTGLTSGLTGLVSIFKIPWLTPAISFSVTFLTAMITLFRFRERGHNQQQTADAIQYEISCATKGIFGYKNLSEIDAYTKLAEETERLINEQRKRQQQLEQSSDTSKHTPE